MIGHGATPAPAPARVELTPTSLARIARLGQADVVMSRGRLAGLAALTTRVANVADAEALVETLLQGARGLLEADIAVLGLSLPGLPMAVHLAIGDSDPVLLSGLDPAPWGILASVARERAPRRGHGPRDVEALGMGLVSAGTGPVLTPAGAPVDGETGGIQIRDFVAVPFASAEHGYGWLFFANRRVGAFDDDDELLASTLSLQAAARLDQLRLKAEFAVAESRYQTLVEQLPAVTYFRPLDRPGMASYVSPQIFEIMGFSSEEWLADPDMWLNRLHPEDRAEAQAQMMARAMPTSVMRPIVVEYRAFTRDGRVVWLRNHALAVRNPDGRPAYVLGVVFDITQEKAREAALHTSEEQLRQSQRMDAIGRLAGGIAHDFNNLLTAIRAYSEMLLQQVPAGTDIHADIEEIRKAAERAASLTQQLLAFSRRQTLAPKVLDLNAILADMTRMLERLIGEDIEYETALAPLLGSVKADPTQLQQVVLNLVVNARDVMPGGGRLLVETANVELDDAFVERYPDVVPGPYALLAVTDSGSGMDAETRDHLFEPFFTTKARGKGTGLGLSTVYGIVKQSQGHLFVASEVGVATTFRIFLPRVAKVQRDVSVGPGELPAVGGPEVILLAEDEHLVRGLVVRILHGFGYTVREAGDGVEALQVCRDYGGAVHLLLTDVVMPRMNGAELARQALAVRPELKVLYMSGYTDREMGDGGVAEDVAFLHKSFSPEQLARKVRELLEPSTVAVAAP